MSILRLLVDILINPRYYTNILSLFFMPGRWYEPINITFNWRVFRAMVRWRHLGLGLLSVIMTLILANLLFQVPFLQTTLLSLYGGFIEEGFSLILGRQISLGASGYLGLGVLIWFIGTKRIPAILPLHVRLHGSGLPAVSIFEEMVWRYGSEHRNTSQMLLSAISFGLIHFANLIYPLAVCVAIILNGVFCTIVYLKMYKRTRSALAATYESSIVHTVHNILAFAILFIWIAYIFVRATT